MALFWKTNAYPRDPDMGPYAHWWRDKEMPSIPEDAIEREEVVLRLGLQGDGKDDAGRQTGDAFFERSSIVPLPKGARNPDEPDAPNVALTQAHLSKGIPANTVLVGIVDTGISLSNARFRLPNGKTRFVASWQQSAPFTGQKDLPCGQEVYEQQINEALDTYGTPKSIGYVDETVFNRVLSLTQPVKSGGQRDLELAAAHGTHVLDLAAGIDPGGEDAALAECLRLISVNLPAQYAHGTAGTFLAYFAVHAVARILHIAEALWARNNCGQVGSYPLVINFSYGMTAGPKDSQHLFEREIRSLLKARDARLGASAAPVRLIMPAGNDNLERCAASAVLGKDEAIHVPTGYGAQQRLELPWRILPSDSTANFVEVWFEAQTEVARTAFLGDLKVWVTPPSSSPLPLERLQVGFFQELGEFARVYVRQGEPVDGNPNGPRRLALLICVAPTVLDVPGGPVAPAGLWTLTLEYAGEPVDAAFYIQSDQSAVRTSKTGRRSYFDHPKYQRVQNKGALADTYSYAVGTAISTDNDNWALYGPVQRRGSHNALATIKEPLQGGSFTVVGGFDDSSGVPAIYSSSTDGNPNESAGRDSISVSYPSENSASLFGLLAAGARDGSVTAYRGTSMATALASRDAARAFLGTSGNGKQLGTEDWFFRRAAAAEARAKTGTLTDHWGQPMTWPKVRYLKSGVGRVIPAPSDRKWHRLGGTH